MKFLDDPSRIGNFDETKIRALTRMGDICAPKRAKQASVTGVDHQLKARIRRGSIRFWSVPPGTALCAAAWGGAVLGAHESIRLNTTAFEAARCGPGREC